MQVVMSSPVREIHKMLSLLKTKSEGAVTVDVLAKAMQVPRNSATLQMALAAILKRFDLTIAKAQAPGLVDAEIMNEFVGAMNMVRRFFEPDAMMQPFEQMKSVYLQDVALVNIRTARTWFGCEFAELSDKECRDILLKLDDVLDEMRGQSLQFGALFGFLETLKLMLANYEFFGREAVEEWLYSLLSAVEIAGNRVSRDAAHVAPGETQTRRSLLKSIGGVIGALVVVFDRTGKGVRSVNSLFEGGTDLVDHFRDFFGKFEETKLLPPPPGGGADRDDDSGETD